MGKAIVYCQVCGTSLREEDFDRGRALRIQNQNYCVACRPAGAPAPPPREATPPPAPRRPTSDRIPVARPESERAGSTGRIPKAQNPPQRNPALLWIAIIIVFVVGGLTTFILASRSETRETPSSVVTPEPPPRPKPPEIPPLEKDLLALRRLLNEPVRSWNTREIDSLFSLLAQLSGPRREELDKLKAEYDRALKILDLREGLIGRWSLDEADGNVAHDLSGRRHDGKIVGTVGRVPGRMGGAFQFRGGDDYVEIPATGALNLRGGSCYTLSAWFMPDTLPVVKPGMANDAWYGIVIRSGYHLGLSLSREGRVEMRHWTGAPGARAVHFSTETISPKVWTHVAGIVDSRIGRTKVFINGKASGELAWNAKASILPLETPWRIGIGDPKSKDSIWSARGLVDEVLFYVRVLSPEEIALLAEGAIPPEADPRKIDPSDAGLAFHLRADRDARPEGSAVAGWSDPQRAIEAATTAADERPLLVSVGGQSALKFDGKNDHLVIPSHPTLTFLESDSFTLAVRVRIPVLPAKARYQGVVTKSLETAPWYGLWIDDRNRWVFGSPQNLQGGTVKLGESVVVAVQEGGKERRLYVDGHRLATGPAMLANGPGPMWIGGANGRPEFFDGEIQEIRLWRRALEPAEIRGLTK